mgnify:FL=1
MFIKSIELKNFRNYDELTLSFNDKVNFIVGNNAQGKTNLLEGIYMSSIGKSFRTSKDSEMIGFGKDFCKIKVTAQKNLFLTDVEIIIRNDRGKSVKVDGVNISKTSDLLENIYIVIFSPEDLKIVKDEPEKRRRFIDRELCLIKPYYFDCLSNYRKVLLQRNTYLKEKNIEKSVLDIWDTQLSSYGAKIISMRRDFIEKINEISHRLHLNITNGKENLKIEYDPSVNPVGEVKDTENILYKCLKDSYNNDMRLRTTTKGPHRDDIQFYIDDVNVRSYGSQGQQRTAALSLKLAELDLIKNETGENAVLLLDDVMSELDNSRQEFLIRSLSDIQLFITSTDITDNLKDVVLKGNIYKIEEGKLKL